MMPEIKFMMPPLREWRISVHFLGGGQHPLTGVQMRCGWVAEFGPLSAFWARPE